MIRNKINILRSDNGGYFTSKDFNDLCKDIGIKRELSVRYNPQQNGIAKRKNNSIRKAMKAVIHDHNLPIFLWEEASNNFFYVRNKIPQRILGDKNHEQAVTGLKPKVSHLRIFSCLVYIHVPKEKWTKLEPSGKKGTFVGYREYSKDYRIYIPGQHQIDVSHHVTFDEDIVFKRSRILTWILMMRSRSFQETRVKNPPFQLFILHTIRRSN